MATEQELIALFGDDFLPILDAIDKGLPDNVEAMLVGLIDKMVFDVETFHNAIEKTATTIINNGGGTLAVQETLRKDMESGGKIFGKLRNDVKGSIVEGINQSSRLGQYQNYDLDKGDFVWVTVGGHRICADCMSREGDKGTFDYHADKGLPASGWSLCGEYCYCILDPTGDLPTKAQLPKSSDLKEKGASIK